MDRRVIAVLASVMLLCAAVLGVAMPLPPSGGAMSPAQRAALIDTTDGVSLDESVIDDLRPSAPQDAPSGAALCLDQLPAWGHLVWRMADGAVSWGRPASDRLPPSPYLGPLIRPPSA